MVDVERFSGVVVVNLDRTTTFPACINDILPNQELSNEKLHDGTAYLKLKLKNKYYSADVSLFTDVAGVSKPYLLEKSEAIVIYSDGTKVSVDQLDSCVERLKSVDGEPRILLYHSIDEDCPAFKTLQQWCIENKYDIIDSNCEKEIIDSLSAYRWQNLTLNKDERSSTKESTIQDDCLKQIQDFDDLLKQITAFKDKPEDDKLIGIAERLSHLLGEDEIDELLEETK